MEDFVWTITHLDLFSVLDILVVSLVFYGVLWLTRGTPAIQLMRGILVFLVLVVLASNLLALSAFNWLLRNSLPALLIAVPVIFQPELRRALLSLGRGGGLINRPAPEATMLRVVRTVSRAVRILAEQRHGAIIVLEAEAGLQEFVETGISVDAELTTELLLTIFHPQTTLHDGAVIIRGDRVVAAAAALPLSRGFAGERTLGLRHRAAVGVTEQSDAVAIVVSEETGIISLARAGRMVRHLDDARLRKLLQRFYRPPVPAGLPVRLPWRE